MANPLHAVPDAVPDTTRASVLRAAAALLAVDSGASLAQIAAAAGVGRTTVHRAFPTRADLLTALALQSVGHLQAALAEARLDDGPVPAVLARIVERVLPLAAELRFLDAGAEVWDLPELLDAWWSVASSLDAVVERGQREGDLRADVPAELVVEAFTGMLWGVWQGVRDGRVARQTATRHLVTLDAVRPAEHRSVVSRRRPFVTLEVTTVLSGTANGITLVAFPWLVLESGGDATAVALIAAAASLPLLVSMLFSGTLIDMLGRRRVAVGSDLLSMVSVAMVPVLAMTVGLNLGLLAAVAVLGAVFDRGHHRPYDDAAGDRPRRRDHPGARQRDPRDLVRSGVPARPRRRRPAHRPRRLDDDVLGEPPSGSRCRPCSWRPPGCPAVAARPRRPGRRASGVRPGRA